MKTLFFSLSSALMLVIGSVSAGTDGPPQAKDGYDPRPESAGDSSHGCRRIGDKIECWHCWESKEDNMTICEFTNPGE